MADGFNGSTIAFDTGVEVPLRSIRYSNSAAKVDVSGAGDTVKTYVAGLKDPEVTFDVVGGSAVAVGVAAAITISWNDGSSDDGSDGGAPVATWLCINHETSGDMDGEIVTSITCVPATAT